MYGAGSRGSGLQWFQALGPQESFGPAYIHQVLAWLVSKEKAGGAAEPMNTPVCAVTRMVTKINLAGLRVLGN